MKLLESEIDQQKRIIDQQQKIGIDQQKMKINSKDIRTHDQESTKQSESKQPMKPASKKVG